jgi:hypothetical protein
LSILCRLFGAERRGGLGHCPGTSTFSEARSILVRTTPPNGPAAPSLAAQVEARPGAGARDRSSHCARLQEPVQTAYRNFNSKRVAAMPPNVTVCRTRETVSGNRHRLERMDFWTGPMLRRELSVGLELMMPPRQPSLPSCSRLSPPSFRSFSQFLRRRPGGWFAQRVSGTDAWPFPGLRPARRSRCTICVLERTGSWQNVSTEPIAVGRHSAPSPNACPDGILKNSKAWLSL